VKVSIQGTNQAWSSSMVGRRFTNQSIPTGRVNSQVMQAGQK
jgi:hypothetical protein